LGQERREEHEVLAVDNRRLAAALAEQARDPGAAEAAAEDQDPASCPPLGHRWSSTIAAWPGLRSRGARSAGGTTIGILPGETREGVSEWIDHVVVTGVGHARNLAVVASGDAVIAVGGAWGTPSEIAFARVLGRPVVVLEPGWAVEGEGV